MARPGAYQTKYHNKIGIYIILFFLLAIAIVLMVHCKSLNQKRELLQKEEAECIEDLAEENQRTLDLQQLEKETQTKGYKIQLARERLNLMFPDEIYYKENND